MTLNLYWGDAHLNVRDHQMDDLDGILRENREHLDFLPLAYYPYTRFSAGPNEMLVEDWLPAETLADHWKKIRDAARTLTEPGRFVLFPGYEWQGTGVDGDHNVFFLDDAPPFLKHDRLADLYADIRGRKIEALAIPHHTAYRPGIRSKNWDIHDEEISPFAEIYSAHGCSESDEEATPLRRNWHMGPGVSGGTIEEGLARGYRLGIMASNDAHAGFAGQAGIGLMACHAPALTRADLWAAFKARHVHAVTGDRIGLRFHVNDAIMGDAIKTSGTIVIRAEAVGSYAIDRIELLRDNRLIATHCHQGAWSPPKQGTVRAKVRYEMGWGPKPLVDVTSSHRWDGRIDLSEGAILGLERGFRRKGQRAWLESDRACRFNITTPRGGRAALPLTDDVTLEIEAPVDATLEFVSGGVREKCTVASAMAASSILYDEQATDRFIQETYGVRREDVYRHDHWYFLAFKVKRYRAIPQAGYTAVLQLQEPVQEGRHHYRVRVEQRNGHRAWSSPIWVEGR